MSPFASLYAFLVMAVALPFAAIRLWRRQRWAREALANLSGWPLGVDGTLAVALGDAVGSARVVDALGHTYVDLRLRFPSAEAAWAALDRVPAAARTVPVAHTGRESDNVIVVRFAWETLVVPVDLVRAAIAEIADGARTGPAIVARQTDPVFAAVARRPQVGHAVARAVFVLGLAALAGRGHVGGTFAAMLAIVGVQQLGQIVRRGLGLAPDGRYVPFAWRFFGFVALFAALYGATKGRNGERDIFVAAVGVIFVLEAARALRAWRVAGRLLAVRAPWIRVEGTVRDPDGAKDVRPFVLAAPGAEYWVEAGPTHTLVAGTIADGARVEVIGRVAELPADSAYRETSRRLLSGDAGTPLTISAGGARPAVWIALEGSVAALVASGYAAVCAGFFT